MNRFGVVLLGLVVRQNLTRQQISELTQVALSRISEWSHHTPPALDIRSRPQIEAIGAVLERGQPGSTRLLIDAATGADAHKQLSKPGRVSRADALWASQFVADLLDGRAPETTVAVESGDVSLESVLHELAAMPNQIFGGGPVAALTRLDQLDAALSHFGRRRSERAEFADVLIWRERSRAEVEVRGTRAAASSAERAWERLEASDHLPPGLASWLETDVRLALFVCERVAADPRTTGRGQHDLGNELSERDFSILASAPDGFEGEDIWARLEVAKSYLPGIGERRGLADAFRRSTENAIEAAESLIERTSNPAATVDRAFSLLAQAHETMARSAAALPSALPEEDARRHLSIARAAAQRARQKTVEYQADLTSARIDLRSHVRQLSDVEWRLRDLVARSTSWYQEAKARGVARDFRVDVRDLNVNGRPFEVGG